MWYFCVCRVRTNSIRIQRCSTHWNVLALKFFDIFTNLKLRFIVIVMVWLRLTHSYRCRFTKNMIQRSLMGSIHRPSDSGSRITESTAFIQCVDGREPQIHELGCLGLVNISRKFHPTARVYFLDVTVREFLTGYLSENGHRTHIIGKLSVSDSVQFLGVTDECRGSGLPFIFNLQAFVDTTGWGSGNYYNQDWGGRIFDANSITNIAWGASINPCPAYLPQSPVNSLFYQRCIRENFLCCRHKERLWHQYNWCNPLINPQAHRRDENRDGPVTQSFLFKIPAASVSNCFIPVAIVSDCLQIAFNITFWVTHGRCVWFIIFDIVDCQILYCTYHIVRFI